MAGCIVGYSCIDTVGKNVLKIKLLLFIINAVCDNNNTFSKYKQSAQV